MGFLSGAKAIKTLQKIKDGAYLPLTMSQMVQLNVNLIDAKERLSPEEFNAVYELYSKLKKDRKKYKQLLVFLQNTQNKYHKLLGENLCRITT